MFKMSSPFAQGHSHKQQSSATQNQEYHITSTSNTTPSTSNPSSKDKDSALRVSSWKLPYSIDDSDLTFDGKPLNLLYEENKWRAEHCSERESRDEERGRTKRRT